ncbi:unnamed protein product [Sphagnum jensenii]
MKEIQANCPAGYTVNAGYPIDMLNVTELWRIYENHPEPQLTRIPQDMVDYEGRPAVGRTPKEWGREVRICKGGVMSLHIVPCELAEANAFVREHHRHHNPAVGHKFSLAVADEDKVVGVAIVGRPVSRMLDDGWTLEVNRLATDGTKNACSMLYAASWRAAKAIGYKKLITYILDTEPGTSLQAAGWKCIGKAGGGSWSVPSRPRVDKHPLQGKMKWEAVG